MQPNQPTDFEVLTAIVSRVHIPFADLERTFPRATQKDLFLTICRLGRANRVEMFWAGEVAPNTLPFPDSTLAIPGYLNDIAGPGRPRWGAPYRIASYLDHPDTRPAPEARP